MEVEAFVHVKVNGVYRSWKLCIAISASILPNKARGTPNKALQTTRVNVAVFRADFVRFLLAERDAIVTARV